jgi:hypothetical protein
MITGAVDDAGEHGVPFLGVLPEIAKVDFQMATFFEKHDTDAVVLKIGPIGSAVAMKDTDAIVQGLVDKGTSFEVNWPGTSCPSTCWPMKAPLATQELKCMRPV